MFTVKQNAAISTLAVSIAFRCSVPSDPANPSLIAEIHEGSCGDLGSAPLYTVENTLGGYSGSLLRGRRTAGIARRAVAPMPFRSGPVQRRAA